MNTYKISLSCTILLLVFSCNTTRTIAKKEGYQLNISAINSYDIILDGYQNSKILQNAKGKVCKISEIENDKFYVVVLWENSFKSIGTLLNGNALGKWYTYNQKGILIEYVNISLHEEFVTVRQKFDKKGNLIYLRSFTPPF